VSLLVLNQQKIVSLPPGLVLTLQEMVNQVLKENDLPEETEVDLTFVDDATIQELNETYRDITAPTDVLSFSQLENTGEEPEFVDLVGAKVLGDIVISLETGLRQSQEYGHSLKREIAFLTIHGLLHLLGYDHQTAAEEEQMFAKQTEILNRWEEFRRE
jgi:probable rRNA maturation factor